MPDTPVVKQDLRPDSKTFGTVAVKLAAGSPLGEWGFMSLTSGGGFLKSAQVDGWTDLAVPNA